MVWGSRNSIWGGLRGAAFATALALAAPAVASAQLPTIPVPDVAAQVHTESGSVSRDTLVPLGGVPVPIDVDDGGASGLLGPDITVALGAIRLGPDGRLIVPNIEIRRDPGAIATGRPAPSLEIDVQIRIRDLARAGEELALIHYGYKTPEGGRVPPVVVAKLLGPITSGFVDPLEAVVLAPGYGGPLEIDVSARTPDLDARFEAGLDPMPTTLKIVEDPRRDGLDAHFEHDERGVEVALDGRAVLTDRVTGVSRHVAATVDRLPASIDVNLRNAMGGPMVIDTTMSSPWAKPDLTAHLRETRRDGSTAMEATARAAGIPSRLHAEVRKVAEGAGERLTGASFSAPGGGAIDRVEIEARNDHDAPGLVGDLPLLGPEQQAAFKLRRGADGQPRFKVAARVTRVRSGSFQLDHEVPGGLLVTADVGDGHEPLRVVADMDDRGPRAPAEAARTRIDATARPLPRDIVATVLPPVGEQGTRVSYRSDRSLNADAEVLQARGPIGADGCGRPLVTCARAAVDRVPATLSAELPSGEDGGRFSLTHSGAPGDEPDIRATIDATPADANQRTYAELALDRLPNDVRGRIDLRSGEPEHAEFHGCADEVDCPETAPGIGVLRFVARRMPERENLPRKPDVGARYLTVVSRDRGARFEIAGRLTNIRDVVLDRRVRPGAAGQPPLPGHDNVGLHVDLGSGADALDVRLDSEDGDASTKAAIHVDPLPRELTACVRKPDLDHLPPEDLPELGLLNACEQPDAVKLNSSEPAATPLSAHYEASSPTTVTTDLETVKAQDRAVVHTVVPDLPQEITVHAMLPAEPTSTTASRRLQMIYDAGGPIAEVPFAVRLLKGDAVCEDVRPGRQALCAEGRVTDLAPHLEFTNDPAPAVGTFTARVGGVAAGDPRPSLRGLRLASSSAGQDTPFIVTGELEDLPERFAGRFARVVETPGSDPVPAAVTFDACPDPQPAGDPCTGIGRLRFSAGNAVQGLDAMPAPTARPTARHKFSLALRGRGGAGEQQPRFVASGDISDLRALGYDRLAGPGRLGPTQRLRLALGALDGSDDLAAYVDLDDGRDRILIDGVVHDLAPDMRVCLRGKLDGETPDLAADTWCARQPADRAAVQAYLPSPPSGARPDVEIDRFEISSGAGARVFTGRLGLDDIGERIDVSAAVPPGGKPELQVLGRRSSGGPLSESAEIAQVVGRIRFDLRNRRLPDSCLDGDDDDANGRTDLDDRSCSWLGSAGEASPTATTQSPDGPDYESADETGNFIRVSAMDGALHLRGSIPDVKAVTLAPKPCRATELPGIAATADADHPQPGTSWPADQRPSYTCARVAAANEQPLAFAVRMIERGNYLAIDRGFVSAVPAGSDGNGRPGLALTLTDIPAGASQLPPCAREPRPAGPCRPPLLSVEAPRSAGREKPRIEARISTGTLTKVGELKAERPSDVFSRRLNYEEPLSTWAGNGSRVKVLTQGRDVALRAALRVQAPRFIDVDQPFVFTCKRNTADTTSCKAPVNTPRQPNQGRSSTDLELRIAASDVAPGRPDASTLGRTAVLVVTRDRDNNRSDIVVTGVWPPGSPSFPNREAPVSPPTGGSWATWENTPDDSRLADRERGFVTPGVVDARIYLRQDFNATERAPARLFAQVDGRVSSPLSLGIRLSRPQCFPAERIGFYSEDDFALEREVTDGGVTHRYDPSRPRPICTRSGGRTRGVVQPDGSSPSSLEVPEIQLAVRNAPAPADPSASDALAEPSFRLRAEVRQPRVEEVQGGVRWTDPSLEGALEGDGSLLSALMVCRGMGDGTTDGIGFNLGIVHGCVLTPRPSLRWLDVALQFDPDGAAGDPPARDIEAVVDLKDKAAVDMRAYDHVLASGASRETAFARFTPQAAMRLAPLTAGLDLGIDVGLVGLSARLLALNDLIIGLSGDRVNRLRLQQNGMVLRGQAEGGDGFLAVDNYGIRKFGIQLNALFGFLRAGVDIPISGFAETPLQFVPCGRAATIFGGFFPQDVRHMTLPNGEIKHMGASFATFGGSAWIVDVVINAISNVVASFSCMGSGADPSPARLVSATAPAPPYEEDGREIPGTGAVPTVESAPDTARTAAPRDELYEVPAGETREVCGTINARQVRIAGTLRVRPEIPPQPGRMTGGCDGRLVVNAESVEVSGRIEAGGTRASGPGEPASGSGAGGGHGGRGGNARGGQGGARYDSAGQADPESGGVSTSVADAFGNGWGEAGSPGGSGSSGNVGGRGGGAVSIVASDRIGITGVIHTSGAPGSSAGPCDQAGGGGSGGRIDLIANRVEVRGGSGPHLVADGGRGGSGGHAGGGGAGGRIRVESFVSHIDGGSKRADGRDGGSAGSGCDGAGGGEGGPTDQGREKSVGGTVTVLDSRTEEQGRLRFPAGAPVRTRISGLYGIDAFLTGPSVFVCYRYLPPDPANTPDDPRLLPTEGVDMRRPAQEVLTKIRDRSTRCEQRDPTVVDGAFATDIDFTNLPEGYYGFYGFAARCGAFIGCEYQPEIPRKEQTTLLAVDTHPPAVNAVAPQGADCGNEVRCVNTPRASFRLSAGDAVTEIRSSMCSVDSTEEAAFTRSCPPGADISVDGLADGRHDVRVRLVDGAGNATTTAPMKYFVDTRTPFRPYVEPPPTGRRGWLRSFPDLVVSVQDPLPSSGFRPGGVQVVLDGVPLDCPGSLAPALSGRWGCRISQTGAELPTAGTHEISARAVDAAGNKREGDEADAEIRTVRVDDRAPKSDLVLAPRRADGSGGWYRTRPALGFVSADGSGGSGVDPADPGSGVRFSVDGGPFERYDADHPQTLEDGVHSVCWYAIDVAGNQEDGGSPNRVAGPDNPANCREGIRVDGTDPKVVAPIPNPDGDDDWYRTPPAVGASATDGGSGVVLIERRVDGFGWAPASGPYTVPDGEHLVETRATDAAGNIGYGPDRLVRVDSSAPASQLRSFAPAPNSRGWYARLALLSVAADDGRGGSGVIAASLAAGGALEPYTGAVSVPAGDGRAAAATARDAAGNVSTQSRGTFRVDLTPPVPRATLRAGIRLGLLSPISLPFDATDPVPARTGGEPARVRVVVHVLNALGAHVRTLPAGWRDAGSGSVTWDGRDKHGLPVLVGQFHYRVQAVDEAGNGAQSTESVPFTIIGLL